MAWLIRKPMLRLSPQQLTALSAGRAATFRSGAIAMLRSDYPARCAGKTDRQLQEYVDAFGRFAAGHAVFEPANILQLMRLQVERGFGSAPDGYLGFVLDQQGLDEGARVRNFVAACADEKPLQLVSLDTPLHDD
jgi:hypothetical protein